MATTEYKYIYQAKIVRIIDGDSLVLNIDLGFHLSFTQHVRLYGINAPELNTPEGKLAKQELLNDYPVGSEVCFISHKDKPDKYGRLLGNIMPRENLEFSVYGCPSPELGDRPI